VYADGGGDDDPDHDEVRYTTVLLRDGTTVRGNLAVGHGGGLYVTQSTLTVSNSMIDANSAGNEGGGVHAQTSCTLTLGDDVLVLRNTARGNGGGLSLVTSCSLATAGRVSLSDNVALGSSSIGGGISASGSAISLGTGDTDLSNNIATAGGGLALIEGSTLADSGDETLVCLLTVRHNMAKTGNGGGISVSGDSSVSLRVSTAVFSQNVAAQHGGGLFIDADTEAEVDIDTVKFNVNIQVTFWRIDLVANAAATGDGGGMFVVVCHVFAYLFSCVRL
jgi:predicted outer membrane repeat protein